MKKEITIKECLKLSNAFYLDVRETRERAVSYIEGSIHIPLAELNKGDCFARLRRARNDSAINIIIYCATGCRSLTAAEILSKQGFNAYSLKGGLKEWIESGQKVVTSSELTKEQTLRYSRQLTLPELGIEGQKKLLNSRVLVVGAGGLGSPAILYLAAAGVGHLGIIDSDKVSIDNLHRQIIHTTDAVGASKTRSAAFAVSNLNNDTHVHTYEDRLLENNAHKLISEYDVVLDGSDNFETKYLINSACVKAKKPLVHGSILRYQGQVSVFHPAKGTPCYACLYPEPPPKELAPSCVEAGVLGAIPGIIGSIQALEAIKLIANIGEPLFGRLLIFDGLKSKFHLLNIKKEYKCSVC